MQTISNQTAKTPQRRPWLGLLIGVWALFLFVALMDFRPEQSWWHSTLDATAQTTQLVERPENLMGGLGVILAFWSLWFFGMAAYLAPMYMGWMSYLLFTNDHHRVTKARCWAVLICLVAASAWLNLFESRIMQPNSVDYNFFPGGLGGQIGVFFYHILLLKFLGSFGSTVIMLLLFGGGTAIIFSDELQKIWAKTMHSWGKIMAKPDAMASEDHAVATDFVEQDIVQHAPKKPRKKLAQTVKEFFSKGKKAKEPEEEEADIFAKIDTDANGALAQEEKRVAMDSGLEITNLKVMPSTRVAKRKGAHPRRKNGFRMPPLNILEPAQKRNSSKVNAQIHQERASALVRILSEFGVAVTPGSIHTGPVVTRYDVYPAQGVRVEKILNLERNLQLGLKSQSVRILAPVPGKSCVGVELPNSDPEIVRMRELLESEDWVNSNADIPIALGKETSGKPLIADLTKMPHLLIAGATGAGKTVAINAIIASLVYRFTPEDLRFVMVDPKIVELQIFNDLPHMMIPVVTSPKKVPAALKYLIKEMEHRYKLFAKIGVKNLAGFNAKRARDRAAMEEAEHEEMSPEERAAVAAMEEDAAGERMEIPDKLPYIVAVVDELADLMMVAPAEIENSIVRLSQLARAAGIHLILATQRPSVNVITGLIKANMPSRIAFKVASQIDSRTIIDSKGADMLIGRGDMLFTPPGAFNMLRAQGAFLADDEVNSIVEALKVNGPPEYDEDFVMRLEHADEEEDSAGGSKGEGGGLVDNADLEKALDVLKATQRASTSMLQRKLGWGYNRAARVMEELEDRGVVAPGEGSRPREILRDTLV